MRVSTIVLFTLSPVSGNVFAATPQELGEEIQEGRVGGRVAKVRRPKSAGGFGAAIGFGGQRWVWGSEPRDWRDGGTPGNMSRAMRRRRRGRWRCLGADGGDVGAAHGSPTARIAK
eukprot:4931739-Prymnesium_polylepis.1